MLMFLWREKKDKSGILYVILFSYRRGFIGKKRSGEVAELARGLEFYLE